MLKYAFVFCGGERFAPDKMRASVIEKRQVYVALGGNVGDAKARIRQALMAIKAIEGVDHLRCSRIYQTSPVGPPQGDFMNAVCAFYTGLTAAQLLERLQQIERQLGQGLKPKNGPRLIDLDLLFFGSECINEEALQVPHPRWSERLFVLAPLSDVADRVEYRDSGGKLQRVELEEYLDNFLNRNQENVILVGE